MTDFTDITYEVDNGLAWITINRPDRYNSFRAQTVDELIKRRKVNRAPLVGGYCRHRGLKRRSKGWHTASWSAMSSPTISA